MQCEDIMKTDVETCHVDDTVAVAARKMKERGIGFVPVCNERGMPMGVLTDRDIVLRVVAEGLDANTRSVVDVMTLEIISCKRDDDVAVASAQMAQNHKSRIVVLGDDGALCGVISLSDIAQETTTEDAGETLRDVSDREVNDEPATATTGANDAAR
jgi:CBS domain-containing protein